MGVDAIPPPASGLPARLVLGPALRAQSDRRLVRLVREGYESAFEEIVRRYRRPLDRFAASIVGGRSEDVTQDSFRKALEALRGGEAEVELRPWLYRIVRNTALNDLRDRPPAAAELAEELVDGGRSAAVEAEQREQVGTLVARLRALPERQRAALVMRELEGMGHEEISTALGISPGAARQAIARGRAAVRGGFGALVPLPLLRALASGGAGIEATAGGAGVTGAAGAGALGGTGATSGAGGALGTAGAGGAALFGGGALKIGLATVVVAGSLGAGVAIDHGGRHHPAAPQEGASAPGGSGIDVARPSPSPVLADAASEGSIPHDAVDDSGSGSHGGDDPGGDHRREISDDSAVTGAPTGDRSGSGQGRRGPGTDSGDDQDGARQDRRGPDPGSGGDDRRSDAAGPGDGDGGRSDAESGDGHGNKGGDQGDTDGSGSRHGGTHDSSGSRHGGTRNGSGSRHGGDSSGSGRDGESSGGTNDSRSGHGSGSSRVSGGSGSGRDGGSGSGRDGGGTPSGGEQDRGGSSSSNGSSGGHRSDGSNDAPSTAPTTEAPTAAPEIPSSSGGNSGDGDSSSSGGPSPSLESPEVTDDHSGGGPEPSGGSQISP